MQVRLLIPRATATGAEDRNQVVEVSDDEAVRMIEAGQAEVVRAEKAPEKAVRKGKAKNVRG